ncbi:hypothetical protein CO134_03645 [Candidatus Kuenenbacteria bacterium CG_4_9_14_3_um_filter_39_14]|uniref:DUF5050 domain-containing protein n=6 Tax=Candidatus Kueneniibacteriota TaxID=1752740 RepID=A0A2M7IL29_9BACT|nr:MAG: hypothetical protein COX28_00710 [Candidatus Kuenenbacteria bacterium CG23_combo_of_CG06-09_8_20_14_all_39_39]PIP75901.1 MAG: hypothetical protein COW86_01125 [Candidatus Kuenenbacteria bacterium CG22_combo_CG10-13_8_21_14_all_39_9]PIR80764.1 MAG: hypothetical protein COU24_02195 [Candidatus Kuenenbacteria bacterium CG10_big_fil_rev_8_21_14_0_10_39_14]PIW95490.1 MAG: hypothetical protein COZ84_03270 [Candidatus Kuenenbacteria bacterium CG_4_8_14_3_um_filter_39_15]PIX92533.1 MAG: hypothe
MGKIFIFVIIISFLIIPFSFIKAESGDLIFSERDEISKAQLADIFKDKILWIGYKSPSRTTLNIFDTTKKTNIQIDLDENIYRASIYEDKIVYTKLDENTMKSTINFYNISTKEKREIASYYNDNDGAHIYGNYIVWEDETTGNRKLYLYDIVSDNTSIITEITGANSGEPAIYGKNIVWDDGDMWIYNIETKSKSRVSSPSLDNMHSSLDIYENMIIGDGMKEYGKSGMDLFVFNMGSNVEKQVADSGMDCISGFDIYEDKVVWVLSGHCSYDQKADQVYLYDLSAEKEYKLTSYESSGVSIETVFISNSLIVWRDEGSGSIYYIGYQIDGQLDDMGNKNIDVNLSKRLAGKLLLQVEDKGRIWYVGHEKNNRYEVTFANALPLFQKLALGISNVDLNKIIIHPDSVSDRNDRDNDGFSDRSEVVNGYNPDISSDPNNRGNDKVTMDSNLANRLKGKLLLQVADKGRIWYVDFEGKRWEVIWKNLLDLFRRLSLGITNEDLNKIGVGEL